MPTTLFYDDNCNSLMECDNEQEQQMCCWLSRGVSNGSGEKSQAPASSLLRALLATSVTSGADVAKQTRAITMRESMQQRDAYEFDECMTRRRAAERRPVIIAKYRTVTADWTWTVESNKHHSIESRDGQLVALHPFCSASACFETYAARTSRPLKRKALTYWEVRLMGANCAGTSLMVGIGNARAAMSSNGYVNLLGIDTNSWGLAIKSGQVWHNNEPIAHHHHHHYQTSESSTFTIGFLYDGYNGRLMFYMNGQRLNVGIEKLKNDEPLYPMVSSTSANSQFRIENVYETMPSLKNLCRTEILNNNSNNNELCSQLLPDSLKRFLNE